MCVKSSSTTYIIRTLQQYGGTILSNGENANQGIYPQ